MFAIHKVSSGKRRAEEMDGCIMQRIKRLKRAKKGRLAREVSHQGARRKKKKASRREDRRKEEKAPIHPIYGHGP